MNYTKIQRDLNEYEELLSNLKQDKKTPEYYKALGVVEYLREFKENERTLSYNEIIEILKKYMK